MATTGLKTFQVTMTVSTVATRKELRVAANYNLSVAHLLVDVSRVKATLVRPAKPKRKPAR